jgi:hypothetical protein
MVSGQQTDILDSQRVDVSVQQLRIRLEPKGPFLMV